jgi:hypothetical protein
VDAVDDLVERMELVAQLVQLVVHDVDAIGRDEVRRDAGPPDRSGHQVSGWVGGR